MKVAVVALVRIQNHFNPWTSLINLWEQGFLLCQHFQVRLIWGDTSELEVKMDM